MLSTFCVSKLFASNKASSQICTILFNNAEMSPLHAVYIGTFILVENRAFPKIGTKEMPKTIWAALVLHNLHVADGRVCDFKHVCADLNSSPINMAADFFISMLISSSSESWEGGLPLHLPSAFDNLFHFYISFILNQVCRDGKLTVSVLYMTDMDFAFAR